MNLNESLINSNEDKFKKVTKELEKLNRRVAFLESELAHKDNEHKQNGDELIEIIKMDQMLFLEFASNCQEKILGFENKLTLLRSDKQNHELIMELFRNLCEITDISRMFKMERVAAQSDRIGNVLRNMQESGAEITDEILNDLFQRLEMFNIVFEQIIQNYKKIVMAVNNDKGKTRSAERNYVDSELVRVNFQDLIRIQEIMGEVDSEFRDVISDENQNETVRARCEVLNSKICETNLKIKSMIKISLNNLFTRFPRMVRDISTELGKKVAIIIEGEYLEINKQLFDKIAEPIIDILRNSIEYGIELPEERLKIGKPEEGLIEINCEINENILKIEIKDDGRGLDNDEIVTKVINNNLISAKKILSLNEAQILDLICETGFSVNECIADAYFCQMNMNKVKVCIEKNLKGEITIENNKNQSFKIVLSIPL